MLEKYWSKNIEFTAIPQAEDCESLETPSRTKSSGWVTALLFMFTFVGAALFGAMLGSHWPSNPDALCTAHVSQFSPVMKDVDISYEIIKFNGSLMKENVFRQDAGPDVDAAWASLGVDYRAAIVPAELAEKSGLIPSQVQVSPKYGGGFPANVEGLHHLHCLNLLRQSLYYNYDHYHAKKEGAFINDDSIVRLHVSHCLDILRQQLMCTVDVAVLGQVWWDRSAPHAYPDFNTRHKCRNFDAVRQWAEKHQAPLNPPEDFLVPPRAEDVLETMP